MSTTVEKTDRKQEAYRLLGTSPVRHDGVDKVTGRANYGADLHLAGMLHGAVLRSPHPHARITSIDTSAALKLEGVLGVVTGDDFPSEWPSSVEHNAPNVIARGEVRYDGHAIAAVAATSLAVAEQAVQLIKVDYEVLPHVTDIVAAARGEVIIDPDIRTDGDADAKPSNICDTDTMKLGDLDKGFAAADSVIEHEFDAGTIHQGYIEPHACVARHNEDGHTYLWVSSQGHFAIREATADILGIGSSDITVTPAEIGGGFGGKTIPYLEPLAIRLAEKTGRPVKMVMTRDEVFRATGPAPGSHIRLKMGATKDGRITAVDAEMWYETGAYPGGLMPLGTMCLTACYDIDNYLIRGYNVLTNKPKMHAYRAPLSPNAAHAMETMIDQLAKEFGIDPLEMRLKNAAKKGTKAAYGPTYAEIGMIESVEAARDHAHYTAPLTDTGSPHVVRGRGVASGFWMNIGGNATANTSILPDGRVALVTGRPDIGGSRAAQAMVLAEELGVPAEQVHPSIGDSDSVGLNGTSEGSSTAYCATMAIYEASQKLVATLRERAAMVYDVETDQVEWRDGAAHLAAGVSSPDDAPDRPLSLAELADAADQTGGPITAAAAVNAKHAGQTFGTHICDVEVDVDTGKIDVTRYTVVQDAGRALHKAYVEGQMQGGAVQGIGWALNEAYHYNDDGILENAGFLDYRMPVALDLPMIDTEIVEVPNPKHPYGVRGVGENGIAAPLAAIANAVYHATGTRLRQVPMTPSRVVAAIQADRAGGNEANGARG